MIKKCSVLFSMIFMYTGLLFSQDDVFLYPSRAEVNVKVECKVLKNDSSLSYDYKVKNDEKVNKIFMDL